ncbi:MAG: 50S ribosomal protein L17 [Acidobacteria bacterium]|nr:50S ribosomal protein L17 [Acidobacteriota bacterium]
MRHKVAHRKLGRTSEHRTSLLRNLCTSLIVNEYLVTTLPKAKELRPFAERVITLGKRAHLKGADESSVHARRLASGYFHAGNTNRFPDGTYKRKPAPRTAGVQAVDKVFGELAERYAERPGGYTRILKLGSRKGDGAEMAIIELVDRTNETEVVEQPKEQKKKRGLFGFGKKSE